MNNNLYILGHPVAHSKSPAMYNALYQKMGLNWEYGFMDIPNSEDASAFVNSREFLSMNITTPWKPLAFRFADISAATAKLAQGANLVVCKDKNLLAYNVDGQGCVSYLERAGAAFLGASVVICGTGPTALSIMHECAQAGCAKVIMLSRSKDKAQDTVNRYLDEYRNLLSTAITLPGAGARRVSFSDAYKNTEFMFGSYSTSKQAIADADIIIDATPLGMKPDDPSPIDTSLIHKRQLIFDTVYGHGVSELLRAAKDAGAKALNGQGMLVSQAVATVGIVCDIEEVQIPFSNNELFDIMAKAANFDL
ncbi:shikimate dehydrogenase [Adlercreutzia sp. ZJ304]|uniref:shikimate dehydrogenase family protein n=1 Tax=Adlercreutzia sp. ZJ304 TaxID=2709791 RepID=UPI001F14EAA0|nr:shikimate dehydrogenase [Adlercreutzia sp. ZJ304]